MQSSLGRVLSIIPFVAGVLMCALCLRLGLWQLHRADEKAARQAALEASAPLQPADASALEVGRRATLEGVWLVAQTVFLDNRVYQNRPGYHVLTPLQLADDKGIVVVDRGWVPADLHREVLPIVRTPIGRVTVTGRVTEPGLKGFRLDDGKETGVVWQRPDPEHFAVRLGKSVAPLIVLQENDGADELVRDWPRPDLGIEKNQGYALQWFSFAAMAFGLTAFFGWRKLRRPSNRS